MRNNFLSKKLKRTNSRILVIDDNQIQYNKIADILNNKEHPFEAVLLDDLMSLEKKLHATWDLIIFVNAYDFNYEQNLSLLSKLELSTPVLLLPNSQLSVDEQINIIQKGIYDVCTLDNIDVFYFTFLRALSYSRSLQAEQKLYNELESAHNQALTLANETDCAIAYLQDGIHIYANAEYLALFGIQDDSEIMGQTILDVLQPEDILTFKQRFKKVSQGQIDSESLQLMSKGLVSGHANINVEFSTSVYDDEPALQVMIQTDNKTAAVPDATAAADNSIKPLTQLKRLLSSPANNNALVLCSINECPAEIFTTGWNTADLYFDEVEAFLHQQTGETIIRISPHQYAFITQAESEDVLRSQLISKKSLEKPQLLGVQSHSFPLQLHLGYCKIAQDLNDQAGLEHVVAMAFRQQLPSDEESSSSIDLLGEPIIKFDIEPELNLNTSFVTQVRKAIDANQVQLRFQQLYDKNDEDAHIFEVSSCFLHNAQWVNLSESIELKSDPEISVMLDRSVLVEASKQFHNFITQYPKARLIVNLTTGALLHDHNLVDLITKLLTIIGSKQKYPLILQFNEEDISQNLVDARAQLQTLKAAGAQLSITEFGNSIYSESILNQIHVDYLGLAKALTPQINNEDKCQELQAKLDQFKEITPVEFILRGLDDMSSFANAWNINTRFLQGTYFQASLAQMVDVHDH